MSVQQDAQYGYDIIVVRSIEDLEVGTIFLESALSIVILQRQQDLIVR